MYSLEDNNQVEHMNTSESGQPVCTEENRNGQNTAGYDIRGQGSTTDTVGIGT